MAWLHGAEEVAFEAFFGEAFFGVRFTGPPESVASSARVCVRALAHACDGSAFFALLSDGGVFPREPGPVTVAEAGAVNAWHSTGSFPIPTPVRALEGFEALWADLQASPLARETAHRKALELVTCDGWFGLPISSPEPPYPLDSARLRQVLTYAAALKPHHT